MMKNIIIKIINDFFSNPRTRSYSIDQPDIFEHYTQNEQIGQPRTNPTPYNNNFQQQNPVNTHSWSTNSDAK